MRRYFGFPSLNDEKEAKKISKIREQEYWEAGLENKTSFPSMNFCKKMSILFLALVITGLVLFLFSQLARADIVDMRIIQQIESAGNPSAFNRASGARGLYQITPIVLQEWNNFHPKNKHTLSDLFNAGINEQIAAWYIYNRIPQLLQYFHKPITVVNVIKSYNAGIRSVRNSYTPEETKKYIAKYNRLKK